MSDTTDDSTDSGGGGRRGPSGRTSSAQQQLRSQLQAAEQKMEDLLSEFGQALHAIRTLESELAQSRAREEEYRSRMERVEALYDADRQKYESLMREVLLSSALDGLSTSLQNLDTTLGAKLAPLAVLTTLTDAGTPVGVADVGRFQEVQGATARFDSNSYVVRRATIVEPGPPPGTPTGTPQVPATPASAS
ncbi:hypothetical protein ACFDTO_11290 [Microbacteriaceae bacterium 4G12]